MVHRLTPLLTLALAACSAPPPPTATSPQSRPDLAGMWSDPPRTALDQFCFMACTDTGLKHLAGLLDDPANDAKPYEDLAREAMQHQTDDYIRPHMTEAGLASWPLDPLVDRGYLYCEPWGVVRQAFAPHQLAIKQYADHADLHYGEWDAHRTVYLDGRSLPRDQPHTPLGFSIGHYEGDTLVVETTRVTEGDGTFLVWDGRHSDQVTIVERYRRPTPQRLELTATLTDPWALREPIELKKVWRYAPDQEIGPYDSCEPAAAKPTEAKTQ